MFRTANVPKLLQSFWAFLKGLLAPRLMLLLLLLVGVFLPFWVFGELAEEVWEDEGGFSWDVPILLAIHRTARPELDAIAAILTRFGVFWGVFPVATGISVYLLLKRRWHSLTYLLTTLIGSIFINRTAKVLLHRVRPNLWISPAPETDFGFPSGHAMSSMTFFAVLVILTWNTRWLKWVLAVGTVFVVAIAWTRLYLGVHYPSDILAGWMVSIAWAIGVKLILKRWDKRSPPTAKKPS